MNVYFFLRKELMEIKQCKKVLLYVMLSSIYPLILNIIANNPLIPLEKGLYLSTIIIACLSGEIIYLTMMEEIKTGTLDMILLSRYKIEKVVILKIIFPSLIAMLASFIGIMINNIVSLYNNNVIALHGYGVVELFFILSSSIFCSIVTIFFMSYRRKADSKVVTFVIALVVILFSILYLGSFVLNDKYIIITIIALTVLAYIITIKSFIYSGEQFHKKRYSNLSLTERDNNFLRCILKREAIKLLTKKMVFLKYFGMAISFIIVNLRLLDSDKLTHIIFLIEIFMINLVFVIDIYFESAKYEKYAKIDDILIIAGIRKQTNYVMPLIIIFILGIICNIFFMAINNIFFRLNDFSMVFTFGHVFLCICSLICSLLICYTLIVKSLRTLKEERVIRIFIYFATVLVFVCLSFLLFYI